MSDAWDAEIAAHLLRLRSAGCSPGTIRLRRDWFGHLAAAVRSAGPWQVTPDDLSRFLSVSHWAPETRKSARGAARTFYRWAEDTGRVEVDPSRRMPTARVPAGVPRPAPEHVVGDSLAARDGPRAAHGAARRVRRAAVRRDRPRQGRHRPLSAAAAQSRSRTGRATPRLGVPRPQIDGHLSPGHVSRLLKRLLGPDWSGHKLRHRRASRAYAGTRDILVVQRLLGHSKPETTVRYVLVPDDSLLAAPLAAAV